MPGMHSQVIGITGGPRGARREPRSFKPSYSPAAMHLGVVNEKALSELGWAGLCAELARRARTPMGRERCAAPDAIFFDGARYCLCA